MLHTRSDREVRALESLTEVRDYRRVVLTLFNTINYYCTREDFHPEIIFGARTQLKQIELYAKGREQITEEPKPWGLWKQTGKIVTRALPTQSAHCYRAASDIALINDITREWMPDGHPSWDVLASGVKNLNLVTGHDWNFRDSAHNEIPDWRDLVKSGELQIVSKL